MANDNWQFFIVNRGSALAVQDLIVDGKRGDRYLEKFQTAEPSAEKVSSGE